MSLSGKVLGFLLLANSAAAQSEKCSSPQCHEFSLLQIGRSIGTLESAGPVRYVESDPKFEEDFTKDDQPDPNATPEPNQTDWQAAGVQIPTVEPYVTDAGVTEVQIKEDPKAKESAKDEKKDAKEKDAEPAKDAKAKDEEPAKDAKGDETSDKANSTAATGNTTDGANATNASNGTNASNVTGMEMGCGTRKDPRAQAWFAVTSPVGTPCIFGVDDRDEGDHCIFDDGEYGTNGWCWTSEDKSSWGSCNDKCPLYGAGATLGNKIDNVADALKTVVHKLKKGDGAAEDDKATEEADVKVAKAKDGKAKDAKAKDEKAKDAKAKDEKAKDAGDKKA